MPLHHIVQTCWIVLAEKATSGSKGFESADSMEPKVIFNYQLVDMDVKILVCIFIYPALTYLSPAYAPNLCMVQMP